MDSIASGRLRHTVTLQEWIETGTDEHGHPEGAWWDVATLRADIQPVGPRDADVVNQLYHEASHIIWLRYHKDVARDTRLKFGDRTFHVGYVQNIDERNRIVKLMCSEAL